MPKDEFLRPLFGEAFLFLHLNLITPFCQFCQEVGRGEMRYPKEIIPVFLEMMVGKFFISSL